MENTGIVRNTIFYKCNVNCENIVFDNCAFVNVSQFINCRNTLFMNCRFIDSPNDQSSDYPNIITGIISPSSSFGWRRWISFETHLKSIVENLYSTDITIWDLNDLSAMDYDIAVTIANVFLCNGCISDKLKPFLSKKDAAVLTARQKIIDYLRETINETINRMED